MLPEQLGILRAGKGCLLLSRVPKFHVKYFALPKFHCTAVCSPHFIEYCIVSVFCMYILHIMC